MLNLSIIDQFLSYRSRDLLKAAYRDNETLVLTSLCNRMDKDAIQLTGHT